MHCVQLHARWEFLAVLREAVDIYRTQVWVYSVSATDMEYGGGIGR